jgi:very-short-patch-repair endonuclease/predicted transcriptional regulator of viral defense system
MATKKSNAESRRARAAWGLARAQHGVLTRANLLALGFSPEAIKHRLATGRLHRVARGIYAVGRPQLTREGQWMAAVLACGPGAALSHGSAAALWGIGEEEAGIEVSVRRRCRHRRRGLEVRSRPSLPSQDMTTHRRIPVTTPGRTALDQATQLSDGDLERLVNEASVRNRIHPEPLRRYVGLRLGEPGVRRLRTLLDRDTFRLSDSELERLFRPIALAAGLPQPLTKVFVNGFEVDFFWPELRLVVETDSLRFHRTAARQARDLRRDQTHTAAGLVPLRFTHWQVKHEPAYIRDVLSATVRARAKPLR